MSALNIKQGGDNGRKPQLPDLVIIHARFHNVVWCSHGRCTVMLLGSAS